MMLRCSNNMHASLIIMISCGRSHVYILFSLEVRCLLDVPRLIIRPGPATRCLRLSELGAASTPLIPDVSPSSRLRSSFHQHVQVFVELHKAASQLQVHNNLSQQSSCSNHILSQATENENYVDRSRQSSGETPPSARVLGL